MMQIPLSVAVNGYLIVSLNNKCYYFNFNKTNFPFLSYNSLSSFTFAYGVFILQVLRYTMA